MNVQKKALEMGVSLSIGAHWGTLGEPVYLEILRDSWRTREGECLSMQELC